MLRRSLKLENYSLYLLLIEFACSRFFALTSSLENNMTSIKEALCALECLLQA